MYNTTVNMRTACFSEGKNLSIIYRLHKDEISGN